MQRVLRESLATAAAQSTATDVAMALASCKDEEAVVQNVLLESASMARSATASGAAAAVDLTKSRSFDTILGPHIRLIVDDRKHGSNKSPEDEIAAFRKKQELKALQVKNVEQMQVLRGKQVLRKVCVVGQHAGVP